MVRTKIVRSECDCVGCSPGRKPHVCPHYNFLVMSPEGSQDWNYTKNTLRPEQVAPGSNKKFWFTCSKCKQDYDQQLNSRLRGCGCPFCDGQKVYDGNSLASCCPDVAAGWDYTKNDGKTPSDFTWGSGKKAHWICRDPKHINEPDQVFRWESIIANRTCKNSGCPSCKTAGYDIIIGGTEVFIERARETHGDKYDYSKTIYVRACDKVIIVCHEIGSEGNTHGEFLQDPDHHIRNRNGCPKCWIGHEQKFGGTEVFIERARETHGDKYDYSKSIYVDALTKLIIICHNIGYDGDMHGEFIQIPNSHVNIRNGCPKCWVGYEQTVGGHNVFIERARKVHGDKYEYPDQYVKAHQNINIICNVKNKKGVLHGSFLQTPNNHNQGRGCPRCSAIQTNSKFAKSIIEHFEKSGFQEGVNMHLEWTDPENLRDKQPLKIDIYLPHERLIIEIDGLQHFRNGWHDKSVECFQNRLRKDFMKDTYAINFGHSILRIPTNTNFDYAIKMLNFVVNKCQDGFRMHCSYRHFLETLIQNNQVAGNPSVEFLAVECPELKF